MHFRAPAKNNSTSCFEVVLQIFLAIGFAGRGSGGNSDPGNEILPQPPPEPLSPPQSAAFKFMV
jgi:hypothetical protein